MKNKKEFTLRLMSRKEIIWMLFTDFVMGGFIFATLTELFFRNDLSVAFHRNDETFFWFKWIAIGTALVCGSLFSRFVKKPEKTVYAIMYDVLCTAVIPAVVYFIMAVTIYGFTVEATGEAVGILAGFGFISIVSTLFAGRKKTRRLSDSRKGK